MIQWSAPYRYENEPIGGDGGGDFSDIVPDGCRLSQISIRCGAYVDGIGISYETPDGKWVDMPFHGGSGGLAGSFLLAPGEYLMSVDGRAGAYVDQLLFRTKLGNVHGPYGGGGGGAFSIWFGDIVDDVNRPSVRTCGIYGRSGAYLDAIGFWAQYNTNCTDPDPAGVDNPNSLDLRQGE